VTTEPVTVVVSRQVDAGRARDFDRWGETVIDVARTFPGFLGGAVLHPGRDSDEFHVVYRFDSIASLRGWEESAERGRWLAEVAGWTDEVRTRRVTGLETWFTPAGMTSMTPPPRWKMWLLSIAAIYPLVLLVSWLLLPEVSGWPLALRALVLPVVTLTLMTYVVMPRLTRWARRFLRARNRA
jgi:antibiotic biosynthesis monooxygenase (ABM) superfamily enzyme